MLQLQSIDTDLKKSVRYEYTIDHWTLVLRLKKLGIGNPYYYYSFPSTRLIDDSDLITLLLHLVYPRVGIYRHPCSLYSSTILNLPSNFVNTHYLLTT